MSKDENDQSEMRLGKYKVISRLGRGAMGMVYKGFDPQIKRYVALKTVKTNIFAGDEAKMQTSIARFKREAQTAGSLNHPNIVSVYEYGNDNDTLYIAMELVKGQELKKIFRKNLKFSKVSQIVAIMAQLLDALKHSHAHGVIHRDIKPGNIIITPSGDIKVADFGIARIESSELTQVGTIIGTPSFMSPEQLTGQVIDARTDLFSAGIVLYQLLTGERPFHGNSNATIMHKILNEKHAPPCALNPKLPKGFDYVMDKALAKNPDDRYQNTDEFIEDIDMAVAGDLKTTAYYEKLQNIELNDTKIDETKKLDGTEIDAARISSSYWDEKEDSESDHDLGNKKNSKILLFTAILLVVVLTFILYVNYNRFTDDESLPPEPSGQPASEEGISPSSAKPGDIIDDNTAMDADQEKKDIIKNVLDFQKSSQKSVQKKPETQKSDSLKPKIEEILEPVVKPGTKLVLRSERERNNKLLKNLSRRSGKIEISHVRSLLRLTTAFVNKTEDAGNLSDIIKKSILNLDIVSHVAGGPADIICILTKNENAYYLNVQSSVLAFGKNEYPVITVEENNSKQAISDMYHLISKIYCFHAFHALEKMNRVSKNRNAKVNIKGSSENMLLIGDKTEICITPKQSTNLMILTTNSMEITLNFPNFGNQVNFGERGKSKCSGVIDIYPPDGNGLITTFMLKDSRLASRFGYSLSMESPYYSWGFDNGQAISFCENIILKLVNEPKSSWAVVNNHILIK